MRAVGGAAHVRCQADNRNHLATTAPTNREVETRLTFPQIECDRCHAAGVVGVACPECGAAADQREADPAAAASTWFGRVSPGCVGRRSCRPTGMDHADRFSVDRFSVWLDEFLTAIADVAAVGPDESAAIVRRTEQLAAMRAAVVRVEQRRPWRAVWRCNESVLHGLDSLASPRTSLPSRRRHPERHRCERRRGNLRSTAVAASAADLARRMDRATRLVSEDGPIDTFRSAFAEARMAAGGRDVLSIEAARTRGL